MSEVVTTLVPPKLGLTLGRSAQQKLRNQPTALGVSTQHRSELAAEDRVLHRAQSGDSGAFEAVLHRHQTKIKSLCRSLARSESDFEDAYQESVQAIWVGLPKFRGDQNAQLSTWIYRVTTNAVTRLYRKRAPEPIDTVPDAPTHRSGGLEDVVVNRELIRWALNQLPDEFREALVLADQLGLKYREIAEIQIVSESTVKTRIFRARQALRHLLEVAND